MTLRVVAAAVFGVLLLGMTAISAQAKPTPPGPGNSPSAQSCYKGGWQNLATSTGQAFASQDACVSYASHGGVLTPKAGENPQYTLSSADYGQCNFTITVTGLLPNTTYQFVSIGNPIQSPDVYQPDPSTGTYVLTYVEESSGVGPIQAYRDGSPIGSPSQYFAC
ncbi:MAG: hypothetical protein ABR571_05220 [Jatrophihabitans sp.]|uniref:hypothetical protein n=1 Tax=Jatrophihabitans sp. TaxID=1932789 RepID=UPI0039112034